VKLRAIDLQYHDMRADKCLADRVGLEAIVSLADAESAMTNPPETTRAYFRGRCLAKWPEDVVAANWDSLVFDVGDDPLRRVPMMEPRRGTAEMVGSLIDECSTARQLLDRLGA
jgi:Pup amidohydrolase